MTEPRIAHVEGARVLDLRNCIAAPTAGRLRADFGSRFKAPASEWVISVGSDSPSPCNTEAL